MNSITIAGNIGRDAETRYLPDGTPIASFSLADNMGKDKGAIFWNCALFGKRAESLAPYLLKGGAVTVTGTVSERKYTDKDGAERRSMDVRVQDVALQGGKREGAAPAQQDRPNMKAKFPLNEERGFPPDDDIPFMDPLKRRGYHLAI